jgi:methylated-DNA-[protein]-cysteine S-methyltransferase
MSNSSPDRATSVTVDTPVGQLLITAESGTLSNVRALDEGAWKQSSDIAKLNRQNAENAEVLSATAEQLATYFSHQRQQFSLPLTPPRTAFAQAVRTALIAVNYGETVSYKDLAEIVGHTGAQRAVGRALAHNPFLIVVPCHRVLPLNGGLGGYSGGKKVKAWLLDHELNLQS